MTNILLIAELTFHEVRRRKIMWAALLLGAAFLLLYGLGFHFIYRELKRELASRPQFLPDWVNLLLMMALYAVNFLIVVMTVLTSVDTISGEIASNTIQAIAVKPIRRAEILLGKWLGFAGMLVLYTAFMIGGVLLATYLESGHLPPHPLEGSLFMILEGLVLLTLSLLGGTFLSTLANGVLVFGLFSVAFIGGWVEQFGSILHNETAVNIGIVASLIMPSEAVWKRAAYLMQPPIFREFSMTPFSVTSPPSTAMMIYVVGYTLVALVLALRVFEKRDL
ncbi:MAG: ABC transporter permease [Chloroflexi bacterium]|nr:ABC transporter permease [Chloroflexota bacterium]